MENNLARQIFNRLQAYLKRYNIIIVNIDEDNSIGYRRSVLTNGPWIITVRDDYRYCSSTWSLESIEECIFTIFRISKNRKDITSFNNVRFLENLTRCKSMEEIMIELDILGI